jgi:prevent-host-death family protein
MSTVNIHQAKTHLSRLVDEAVRGGEVIIARANKPLVKLVPVEEARPPRRLGTVAGKVWMSEDFDEPLPDFDEYR